MTDSARDILPKPFAWVEIPEGKVTLIGATLAVLPSGKTRTYNVPTFSIAKYPTTNTQYAKFMEAGGYTERKWWKRHFGGMHNQGRPVWSNEERDWVPGTQSWLEPTEWHNSQLNQPDHPVVGISWYEADAFCHWLSEITGEPIALPNEVQWQRAAQGDTDWAYPWGETFDEARCYNVPNSTCAVTEYEGKGDSPFGVVDMAGNVNEWCDSESVIRGKGKINMCGQRGNPFVAKPEIGFRIARVTQFPWIISSSP